MPLITCLLTVTSEMVDCTPAVLSSCHIKSSIGCMVS